MSTKQAPKSNPALSKPKHGPPGKATPRKGINSRQPRPVRDNSPQKQPEELQAANSNENSVKDGKGGGGSSGETQTSEQNKETGNTTQQEATMAEDQFESKGAKKSPDNDNGEENHKDLKRKEEKTDEKHRKKKTKPANTKTNESKHNDKNKREKSHDKKQSTQETSSKDTPATSNNNGKQAPGKTNPKHSATANEEEHDKPNVNFAEQIDDRKTQTEKQEEEEVETQAEDAEAAQTDRKESAPRKEKKKASLDEESLQMFLSTDDIEDDFQQQWMAPDQYSIETKRKQREIIRQILEEFDLEETMRKYRNSSVYVYRRDGKSLADFRFRSELIRMMGSEEIRLNDQEWSKKFQDKLREDYDRLLDQQERNLAKAERHRLYRLKMEGISNKHGNKEDGKADDSFDCDLRLHKTPHALAHGQIERKSVEGRRKPSSLPLGETDIFADEDSCRREREMQAQRHEKVYYPCEDVATQISHMAQKAQEEEMTKEFGDIESSLSSSLEHRKDISDLKDGDKRALMERRAERQKRICSKVPPNIARLYKEETTSGLYQIAAEILSSGSP